MVGVLFVCMGNICRSPLGEGVFKHLAMEAGLVEGRGGDFHCSSAGTIGYHVGNPPDPRSQEIAKTKGIDISSQRSQKVKMRDFDDFDYIIAMDRENLGNLNNMTTQHHHKKISLLLAHGPSHLPADVPDPYYGGNEGFKLSLDLIWAGTEGLLENIMKVHFPNRGPS